MKSKEINVDFKIGIHSRPAALLVKKVREYSDHKVNLIHDEKTAPANSLIGMLSLGVGQGSVISIQVDGPREGEVLEELVEFFHEKVASEG